MRENIEKKLQAIPEAPGVYRMLDSEGRIIYIGKSKCLKKRVQSYFAPNPKWEKAEKMVRFIHDLEITVTDTHLDAMLLECALIKEIKPYFNAAMKNDQKYVYLKVEKDFRKAPLKLVREKEPDAFGPIRSRRITEEFLTSMRNLYPLEKVKNTLTFTYHVLPLSMNQEQFETNYKILMEICEKEKEAKRFLKRLEFYMQEAAGQEKFELAMKYRDLVQTFSYLQKVFNGYQTLMKKDVVYSVPIEKGYKYFYIREGMVIDTGKEPVQSEEMAVAFAEKVKNKENLPEREKYLSAEISDKGSVDFKSIVYGELLDREEGTKLYEISRIGVL